MVLFSEEISEITVETAADSGLVAFYGQISTADYTVNTFASTASRSELGKPFFSQSERRLSQL